MTRRARKSGRTNYRPRLQVLEPRVLLSAGELAGHLDSSFGNGGLLTTDFFGRIDQANCAILQPDGKILVAGSTSVGVSQDHYALVRYNGDGSLDNSFGTGGKVDDDFGEDSYAMSIALQPDGRIVVACDTGSSVGDFAVARYDRNGFLDPTFDGDGKVISQFPGVAVATVKSVALQSDGKIVVAGETAGDIAVARYLADGRLDTSFDGDGLIRIDLPGGSIADRVFIQPDDKILIAGGTAFNGENLVLVRINSDGQLDGSFDGDGIVMKGINGSTDQKPVAQLQQDGRIVIGGWAGSDFLVGRYNTDGQVDTSFDADGFATVDFGGSDALYDVFVQTDGKIVATGSTGADFAVCRLNADGSLDTSLAGTGKIVQNYDAGIFNLADIAYSVLVQPQDGRILAVGKSDRGSSNGKDDFALARFEGIPQGLAFDMGPYTVPARYLFNDSAATRSGLIGSYVNKNLQSVTEEDWGITQQGYISKRTDPQIHFTANGWGSRATVGLSPGHGTDADWEDFSVQWDGYVQIVTPDTALYLASDDGSRMWIDVNGDGQFDTAGGELFDNGWGHGQSLTLSSPSSRLQIGLYKIRIQYEEAGLDNRAYLLWSDAAHSDSVVDSVQRPNSLSVVEGELNDSYRLALTRQPSANVTVSIASQRPQVSTVPAVLTFTPQNWATPQTVQVSAANDSTTEGLHQVSLTHAVQSTDQAYAALPARDLEVAVADPPSYPPITINPGTPSTGIVGRAYIQQLAATGGSAHDFQFAVTSGTLPPGLSFDSGGLLSGTPTVAGSFGFTITVTDGKKNQAIQQYTLVVAPAVTIGPTTLPEPVVGNLYNQQLTPSGGSNTGFSLTVSNGRLPDGLILTVDGMLTGTPSVRGQFSFTVVAMDSLGDTGSTPFSVIVHPAPADRTPTTVTLSADSGSSTYGQGVPLTATIAPISPGVAPTGTITFLLNGMALSTVALDASGRANAVASRVPVGSYTITATYSGDGESKPSSSTSGITHEITALRTATTLLPPTIFGQSANLVANVLSLVPGISVSEGSVTFMVDGAPVSRVAVVNGMARLTVPNVTSGNHAFAAVYDGTENIIGSSSSGQVASVPPTTRPTAGASSSLTSLRATVSGTSSGARGHHGCVLRITLVDVHGRVVGSYNGSVRLSLLQGPRHGRLAGPAGGIRLRHGSARVGLTATVGGKYIVQLTSGRASIKVVVNCR